PRRLVAVIHEEEGIAPEPLRRDELVGVEAAEERRLVDVDGLQQLPPIPEQRSRLVQQVEHVHTELQPPPTSELDLVLRVEIDLRKHGKAAVAPAPLVLDLITLSRDERRDPCDR